MNKKFLTTVILTVTILYFITMPIFAESLIHTSDYNLSGSIMMKKQIGHYCNTGSEQKQTISGNGDLTKEMSVYMVKGKTTVDDNIEFVTADSALHNIVITSVIKFCSPPKHTYNNVPVAINSYFRDEDQPPASWYNYALSEGWKAVSSQIWAVRVEAYPGYAGRLTQDYEAAYGPYTGGSLTDYDDRWRLSSDGESARRGPQYVGDYFNIRQRASANMGEIMRYIDVSSPWSHAYLYEDTKFVGVSSIWESFRMTNIRAGSEIAKKWWHELF